MIHRALLQCLAADRPVASITFTGSIGVGRSLGVRCAARGARVQLEMDGKNTLVVLDDAALKRAIDVAVDGSFFQAGQRCTASSRLFVTEGVAKTSYVNAAVAESARRDFLQ